MIPIWYPLTLYSNTKYTGTLVTEQALTLDAYNMRKPAYDAEREIALTSKLGRSLTV